jgi:hypothetical protein
MQNVHPSGKNTLLRERELHVLQATTSNAESTRARLFRTTNSRFGVTAFHSTLLPAKCYIADTPSASVLTAAYTLSLTVVTTNVLFVEQDLVQSEL